MFCHCQVSRIINTGISKREKEFGQGALLRISFEVAGISLRCFCTLRYIEGGKAIIKYYLIHKIIENYFWDKGYLFWYLSASLINFRTFENVGFEHRFHFVNWILITVIKTLDRFRVALDFS